MKKLKYALFSLALLSCGSTPKNEISKIVPQPQQGESLDEFRRRCTFDKGALNNPTNPTLCRMAKGSAIVPRESDLLEDKDFNFGEQNAGFQISGSYVGSGNPPELLVAGAVEERGNMTMKVVPRGGKTVLRAYAGNYDSFSFTIYNCYGIGNSYASCENY